MCLVLLIDYIDYAALWNWAKDRLMPLFVFIALPWWLIRDILLTMTFIPLLWAEMSWFDTNRMFDPLSAASIARFLQVSRSSIFETQGIDEFLWWFELIAPLFVCTTPDWSNRWRYWQTTNRISSCALIPWSAIYWVSPNPIQIWSTLV